MRLTALSLKQRVVIVGSGSGGLSTAARLAKSQKYNISIVDSAKTHYYQPLWTLVGGGQVELDRTGKSMASMIPNSVGTATYQLGIRLSYDLYFCSTLTSTVSKHNFGFRWQISQYIVRCVSSKKRYGAVKLFL